MTKQRHLKLRAERRTPTDLRRLSRALIDLAQAQAEAEAQAAHQQRAVGSAPKRQRGHP